MTIVSNNPREKQALDQEAHSQVAEAAQLAYESGLTVLPAKSDGSKRPEVASWKEFTSRRPTEAEFSAMRLDQANGFGVIAGNGLDCWDFDDARAYRRFVKVARAAGLDAVVNRIRAGYMDETPGGGRRWLVRCPADAEWHDQVLAARPAGNGTKTLIEFPTYSIVAPSNGRTHPSGKAYVRRSGDFDAIASYTADEREALLTAARSLDERPRQPHQPRSAAAGNGNRPGDAFNRSATWADVLEPHGWRVCGHDGDVTQWTRPGKDFGVSATTNFEGTDLLWVFSSSTKFESNRSYDRFAAYTVLNHDSNFRAAARALRRKEDSMEQATERVVCLADVKPEKVDWLWRPYIPLGKLTIIEGDPGLGKSWLSLGIGASVTLGKGLPNCKPFRPRNVLLLSSEDGLGDTIRPRLDEMRADLDRVFAAEDVAAFDDPGLQRLEEHIETYDAHAVFIDPWVAYFGGDLNKANETRRVLKRLAAIAERRHCAIVLIRHLTKGTRDKSIYRGQGNVDITAAARSALLVGVDPKSQQKALVHIKSNLAMKGPSLNFSIDSGRFVWGGISDLTAEHLLAAERPVGAAKADAMRFLRDALANGPVPAKELEEHAIAEGFSATTIRRAKRALCIETEQVRKGRRVGGWTVSLPTAHRKMSA
jgi:hypothetical protein